ncbi:unnamed protein product [Caenorhabditis angaria]|uniref:Exonuclease domain-containing protein n=1 Tax=Caenorhabditis angaria TaxID=860376 RepID=A0A9P1IWK4_9PELO|nr:unnamed protein product [Caenorhabditis angaria]
MYTILSRRFLSSEEDLRQSGYPYFQMNYFSGEPAGKVTIRQTEFEEDEPIWIANGARMRLCCRCKNDFELDENGEDVCLFHLKKAKFDRELQKFVSTPRSLGPVDPRNRNVFGIDCEMVYTRNGPAVARVSLVDFAENVVLDIFVKPEALILDPNTEFSGLTVEMIEEKARDNLETCRQKLFRHINSRSILIGHSLEADLKALRIAHLTVIDTALLFGGRMKPSLKKLARKHLRKSIQQFNPENLGHDSVEDARTCVQLVKQLFSDPNMIFISLAHSYIPKILCILSTIINTFFITLVHRKSSISIGKYKYLLITFSIFNIITSLLELIAPISTESFQISLIVFVADSLIYEYHRDLTQFLISLRCSMVCYTFGLISIHFLYRYFAICKNYWLNLFFKPKYILIMWLLVSIYGSSYLILIAKYMWPDDVTRQKLNLDFIEKYNESTGNIPFIIASYGQPEIDPSGIIAMGSATIISIISLTFDAVLATKIHFAIKNKVLSNHVKRVHRNLLKTLIAQTVIPSFLTFIPCFICWFFPLLKLDQSYYINSIFVPMISAYPVIDPIVIIFALNDYRRVLCKKFAVKTPIYFYNNTSSVLQTTRF